MRTTVGAFLTSLGVPDLDPLSRLDVLQKAYRDLLGQNRMPEAMGIGEWLKREADECGYSSRHRAKTVEQIVGALRARR